MTAPLCLDVEVRPVPGFPVSVSAAGAIYGAKGRREVHPGTNGYLYATVRLPGRARPAKLRVHTAVLLAWIGPKPEGQEGRHLNGNLLDNRVENLVWSTHAVNIADKERHGTMLRGAAIGSAKLTEDDVRIIRAAWPGLSLRALAERYGVRKSTVARVVRGESWRHLP